MAPRTKAMTEEFAGVGLVPSALNTSSLNNARVSHVSQPVALSDDTRS
jgi:hypothetical protein